MPHRLDAVYFSGVSPDIEFRDDAFHVRYKIGSYSFEVALPPKAFFAALAKALEASREFRARCVEGVEKIVPLEPGTKFERVYPADKAN